jgi:magnesium-transporting ATPase (P-type)
VEAEIEPAGKIASVKKPGQEGKHVAMAGDGITDAPALSEAEVGISKAIRRSRATMSNIRQNLDSPFSTTLWAFRSQRVCFTRFSAGCSARSLPGRDECEFRLSHQQRPAAAES